MELNANKFGFSMAVSASLVWIICSALVILAPATLLSLSSHMVHMDIRSLGWSITYSGFLSGLVGWGVVSGVLGWLMAKIYNQIA